MSALPTLDRKVIRADGTETLLTSPQTIAQIEKLIGADTMDTVNMRDPGRHVMLVDDLGHSKKLPVNQKATELYWSVCRPGTTHTIRGDVVIVPDYDFGGPL
ncbi:MAG: hypothetical protein ACREMA_17545 [Longimicrobiales bacterium]